MKLEFRIPVSPTPGFFSQVRFFDFALRRLGPIYRDARLVVAVGDNCDLEAVIAANAWSEASNVVWMKVPKATFDAYGIWGTANWRLQIPAGDADVIILSDADTVLLRDIDPLLRELSPDAPSVRGHMAHAPPPVTAADAPRGDSASFWPWLFERFGLEMPAKLHRYSMDAAARHPSAPAYFNLGFVALSASALEAVRPDVEETERRLKELTASPMRCQIGLTILAHRAGIYPEAISAAYNAANDMAHLSANNLSVDDIRVVHYLRGGEIDRSSMLLQGNIDAFLDRSLVNPVNQAVQSLVREYRRTLPLSHIDQDR